MPLPYRPTTSTKSSTKSSWKYQPFSFVILKEDTATTRPVAVVNEAFARRFFKNENPLGKHFGPDKIQYASKYEIVGVVKDILSKENE